MLDIDYGRHEFTCPVRALRNWREASQITSGRLSRHIKKGGRWRDYDTMSGYVHKGKEFKLEWSKRLWF